MIRHIEPFDNKNKPIVDIDNKIVPLVYFNRIFLNRNESSEYSLENWLQIIPFNNMTCSDKTKWCCYNFTSQIRNFKGSH